MSPENGLESDWDLGLGKEPATLTYTADMTLDVRGLACPLPVLKARKALTKLAEGAVLEVLATEPHSIADFEAFCGISGHKLLARDTNGPDFRFLIRKCKA